MRFKCRRTLEQEAPFFRSCSGAELLSRHPPPPTRELPLQQRDQLLHPHRTPSQKPARVGEPEREAGARSSPLRKVRHAPVRLAPVGDRQVQPARTRVSCLHDVRRSKTFVIVCLMKWIAAKQLDIMLRFVLRGWDKQTVVLLLSLVAWRFSVTCWFVCCEPWCIDLKSPFTGGAFCS